MRKKDNYRLLMSDKKSDRHNLSLSKKQKKNNKRKKRNNSDINSNSRITLYIILNGRVAFVIIGFLI